MKEPLLLIKVGGKIVEEQETLRQLLARFSKINSRKILVHGGGRSATKIATQLGVETQMVNGRRVTDLEMLKVVTMVYGGLVNKQIVASLQALHINAIGLVGADLNYMRAEKRPANGIDYGYVGDVKEVDAQMLSTLLNEGVVPVLAPLTHDGKGTLLNTNADTIAGEVAKALADRYDVTLMYCFEKKGVLSNENDPESVIDIITPAYFESLKAAEVVQGGMIPKLENAFEALRAGVKEVVITCADQIGGNGGTKIRA